ncbi:hypothetical protein C8Q79DRAFT_362686 [Trametes meyenii]|nr:hypothetical protein C8Q79DRAFT_362686 [Trametes meyenii]
MSSPGAYLCLCICFRERARIGWRGGRGLEPRSPTHRLSPVNECDRGREIWGRERLEWSGGSSGNTLSLSLSGPETLENVEPVRCCCAGDAPCALISQAHRRVRHRSGIAAGGPSSIDRQTHGQPGPSLTHCACTSDARAHARGRTPEGTTTMMTRLGYIFCTRCMGERTYVYTGGLRARRQINVTSTTAERGGPPSNERTRRESESQRGERKGDARQCNQQIQRPSRTGEEYYRESDRQNHKRTEERQSRRRQETMRHEGMRAARTGNARRPSSTSDCGWGGKQERRSSPSSGKSRRRMQRKGGRGGDERSKEKESSCN